MTARHCYPTRRTALALCLAASWLVAAPAPAHAQADNWPAKPIRIVVGFPAARGARRNPWWSLHCRLVR